MGLEPGLHPELGLLDSAEEEVVASDELTEPPPDLFMEDAATDVPAAVAAAPKPTPPLDATAAPGVAADAPFKTPPASDIGVAAAEGVSVATLDGGGGARVFPLSPTLFI